MTHYDWTLPLLLVCNAYTRKILGKRVKPVWNSESSLRYSSYEVQTETEARLSGSFCTGGIITGCDGRRFTSTAVFVMMDKESRGVDGIRASHSNDYWRSCW